MNRRRTTPATVVLTGAAALFTVLFAGLSSVLLSVQTAGPAHAHGSLQNPASRAYVCWQEGAEHPQSTACKAAVAAGGTQAIYDWNEINIANAAGRHREIIPDGRLCSAGRDKYKGFDLARADWPAATLPTSGSYTFTYRATAPHRGTFELYVTRNGYDPTRPLRWSDLEAAPFSRVTNPPLSGGSYTWTAQLPQGRSGRHLVYTIWQRSDSPEAFYACSDVVFGSGGNPSPPPPGPCGSVADWDATTVYTAGQQVSHKSRKWEAKWWTQGEEPGTTGEWGAWKDVGPC
jgi:predicted carbohydrate-binding protein with CBM5 and CBM33 domain